MADQQVNSLTAAASLAATDILYTVRNPFGLTDDRKITADNARNFFQSSITSAPGNFSVGGNLSITGDIVCSGSASIVGDITLATFKGTVIDTDYGGTGGNTTTAITALGTVASGTWNASVIDTDYGGTGGNTTTAIVALGIVAAGTWQGGVIATDYGGTGQNTLTSTDMALKSAANTFTGTNEFSSTVSFPMGILPAGKGTDGQYLHTAGTGTLSWSSVTGGAGVTYPEFQFMADQFDNPNSLGGWAIGGLSPVTEMVANSGIKVRAFDDTTEEGIGFDFIIPSGTTEMTFDLLSKAATAPGTTSSVGLGLYHREIADEASITAWSAIATLAAIVVSTSGGWFYDSQVLTLTQYSLTAGLYHQFELTRNISSDVTDSLTGDYYMKSLRVRFT